MDTNILSVQEGQPAPSKVKSFNASGFTVNGDTKLSGAIALFPKTALQWKVCPFSLRGTDL
jgi:hypothetical protein